MSPPLCIAIPKGIEWTPPVDLAVRPCSFEAGQDCPPCDLALVQLSTLQAASPPAFSKANLLFVLLSDSDSNMGLWTLPQVVGFGRSTDPKTWEEVEHVLHELQERKSREEAETAGAIAIGEQASFSGSPFISHFRGVMRQFYQDLKEILVDIPPLEASEFSQDPFRGVSPRQWLDFYGYKQFGAFLKPDEAEALRKEIEEKIGTTKKKRNAEQTFKEIFHSDGQRRSVEPLLLQGETGVGKTVVVKMIYEHLVQHKPSNPVYKPPLTLINCAGLGNLLESELFGAMAGAYTSANVTNPGKIVFSYGGIVFLDEIGTMRKEAQEKLLVYLDRGEVTPEGWSGEPMCVPVYIIAATNADLLDEVQKGNFRADLYYRFERHLKIPPLRERGREELELFVRTILSDGTINPCLSDGSRTVQSVSGAAWDKLMQHDYPGNFRELQSVLREGVKKAKRLRSQLMLTSDIVFEKSPLPQQHSVIGIIKAHHDGQDWFLLRFNPNWYNYFLISGRFEPDHHHTFEDAMRKELDEKLGLNPDQYDLGPIDTGGEVKLIQYSDRDKKLKHYTFHLYGIILKEDPWAGKDLTKLGLLWVTHEHIQQERGPGREKISPTIRELTFRANSFLGFPVSSLQVQ